MQNQIANKEGVRFECISLYVPFIVSWLSLRKWIGACGQTVDWKCDSPICRSARKPLSVLCEFLFTVCPCLGILAEISFFFFLSVCFASDTVVLFCDVTVEAYQQSGGEILLWGVISWVRTVCFLLIGVINRI